MGQEEGIELRDALGDHRRALNPYITYLIKPLKHRSVPHVLVEDGVNKSSFERVYHEVEVEARWHVGTVGLGVDVFPPYVSLDARVEGVEDIDHPC